MYSIIVQIKSRITSHIILLLIKVDFFLFRYIFSVDEIIYSLKKNFLLDCEKWKLNPHLSVRIHEYEQDTILEKF